jgi:hypothetical protein
MKFLKTINPKSVVKGENWLILHKLNENESRVVESQNTEYGAKYGVLVLNNHESKNGREPNYFYLPSSEVNYDLEHNVNRK